MKIVFVIKFPAFWCFAAFQESPQSDFPRDNEGGECEKRVERNYMEKVFRVETTKLRGFLFAFSTYQRRVRTGERKKSRQSCRHFNCIYSYLNFNASTSSAIPFRHSLALKNESPAYYFIKHSSHRARLMYLVSERKFYIKKIFIHRVAEDDSRGEGCWINTSVGESWSPFNPFYE